MEVKKKLNQTEPTLEERVKSLRDDGDQASIVPHSFLLHGV